VPVHQLYDVVTNGFTFTMRIGGKKNTMNREALTAYLRSPKAAVREAAYHEMYRVYETQQDLLGGNLQNPGERLESGESAIAALQDAAGVPESEQRHSGSRRGGPPLRLHEQRADLPAVFSN
jgi:hypothetical protein